MRAGMHKSKIITQKSKAMKNKAFKPTPEMIQATNAVLMAMAYTETIRPRIEKIQNELITFWKFEPCQKWKDRKISDLPEVITKWKHSYMLSDEDAKLLFAEYDEQIKKAGFNVEPGYCPLLIAEDVERRTKRFLIDVMEPTIKMSADELICSKNGLENYKKVIDLTLRLLTPYATVNVDVKERRINV